MNSTFHSLHSTIFSLGHETTANTITFAILELCKNATIQEKLYNEVKDFKLSQDTDPLASLFTLKYLDNVFKETQRLHSIVHRVVRTNYEPVELEPGHVIPKGSILGVYIKGVHLNPEYHPDPLLFNPDRFDGDIDPLTFIPFGYFFDS